MYEMNITSAQYVSIEGTTNSINATIEGGNIVVPIDPNNRHYAEITRQVEAGELTIQEASD
jgi:hypothetical protein